MSCEPLKDALPETSPVNPIKRDVVNVFALVAVVAVDALPLSDPTNVVAESEFVTALYVKPELYLIP